MRQVVPAVWYKYQQLVTATWYKQQPNAASIYIHGHQTDANENSASILQNAIQGLHKAPTHSHTHTHTRETERVDTDLWHARKKGWWVVYKWNTGNQARATAAAMAAATTTGGTNTGTDGTSAPTDGAAVPTHVKTEQSTETSDTPKDSGRAVLGKYWLQMGTISTVNCGRQTCIRPCRMWMCLSIYIYI